MVGSIRRYDGTRLYLWRSKHRPDSARDFPRLLHDTAHAEYIWIFTRPLCHSVAHSTAGQILPHADPLEPTKSEPFDGDWVATHWRRLHLDSDVHRCNMANAVRGNFADKWTNALSAEPSFRYDHEWHAQLPLLRRRLSQWDDPPPL